MNLQSSYVLDGPPRATPARAGTSMETCELQNAVDLGPLFQYIQNTRSTSYSLRVSSSHCVMYLHNLVLRNCWSSGSRFITGVVSFYKFLLKITKSLWSTSATYLAIVPTLNAKDSHRLFHFNKSVLAIHHRLSHATTFLRYARAPD